MQETSKTELLIVSINGSGNANLDVEVENIAMEIIDAGDLSIQRITKQQRIVSNGSRGTLSNANLVYSKLM